MLEVSFCNLLLVLYHVVCFPFACSLQISLLFLPCFSSHTLISMLFSPCFSSHASLLPYHLTPSPPSSPNANISSLPGRMGQTLPSRDQHRRSRPAICIRCAASQHQHQHQRPQWPHELSRRSGRTERRLSRASLVCGTIAGYDTAVAMIAMSGALD